MVVPDIKRRVRIWLVEHDHTQAWLAAKVRFSQPHLSKVLDGQLEPSDVLTDRVRRVTGIDLTSAEEAVTR
jgi:ribosome-binding protein aMBF1 (putative translation factor)